MRTVVASYSEDSPCSGPRFRGWSRRRLLALECASRASPPRQSDGNHRACLHHCAAASGARMPGVRRPMQACCGAQRRGGPVACFNVGCVCAGCNRGDRDFNFKRALCGLHQTKTGRKRGLPPPRCKGVCGLRSRRKYRSRGGAYSARHRNVVWSTCVRKPVKMVRPYQIPVAMVVKF
jgi:hypothetical protein